MTTKNRLRKGTGEFLSQVFLTNFQPIDSYPEGRIVTVVEGVWRYQAWKVNG